MGAHQIIYTSYIDQGINEEQKFFYDKEFKNYKSYNFSNLFSYHPPVTEKGKAEEIAESVTQIFMFRKLGGINYVITLNTYLGGNRREGGFNYLSHSVIFDRQDNYPCEYFGSEMLESAMDFSETSAFLSVPKIKKGETISIDSVMNFLNSDNRMKIYKNMFYALLAFNTEKKRIVICDKKENIIFWIAALEYALPVKNAYTINFTTYEYDPSLSVSQICGVATQGTHYNPDDPQHFIFDLINNKTVDFNIEDDFYEFLDLSMSISYDPMRDFHKFLNEYSYNSADGQYYDAYAFYIIRRDGLSNSTLEAFNKAVSFANKYAKETDIFDFADGLLSQKDIAAFFPDSFFLCVINFIMGQFSDFSEEKKACIQDCIFERMLDSFSDIERSEEDFQKICYALDSLSKTYGFTVVTELMKNERMTSFYKALHGIISSKKMQYILTALSVFCKKNNINADRFNTTSHLGKLYHTIITAIFEYHPNLSGEVIHTIFDNFSDRFDYLIKIVFFIEEIIVEYSDDYAEVPPVWDYFYKTAVRTTQDRLPVFKELLHLEKYEHCYGLYQEFLSAASSLKECDALFAEHIEIVMQDGPYRSFYLERILTGYYERLDKYSNTGENKRSLLNLILSNKFNFNENFGIDFDVQQKDNSIDVLVDKLIEDYISIVPIKKPSKENREQIAKIIKYKSNIEKLYEQRISGRTKFFAAGVIIEEAGKSVGDIIEEISRITGGDGIDTTQLMEKEQISYINWIQPCIVTFSTNAEELKYFFTLFIMTRELKIKFAFLCLQYYFKQSNEKNAYMPFVEYIKFIIFLDDEDIYSKTGEYISKLNKQKMAVLNESVLKALRQGQNLVKYWVHIRDLAKNTSSIISGISKLFKN